VHALEGMAHLKKDDPEAVNVHFIIVSHTCSAAPTCNMQENMSQKSNK
jgi:hypothetical protein